VQAAIADRGHAGVPNHRTQVFGQAFACAAGRCGNGGRVGARTSLARQHAPEHVPPNVVARHRLTISEPDSMLSGMRRPVALPAYLAGHWLKVFIFTALVRSCSGRHCESCGTYGIYRISKWLGCI
jgi:hypothetical protein